MDSYLGVLSSDSLNRDGCLILFDALEKSVADNALKGIPSLIDHDFHRPLGWVFPFGILIEPKISKTIGNFLICETEEDLKLINPKIQEYWNFINYEHCKDYIEEFKELLKDNYSNEGSFIEKGCVTYNLQNIAEKLFTKLFEKKDKDGLLYLNDILVSFEYIGCGIFKSKTNDFCIFCHQFFKRNLSLVNNYNTYFIDEFIKLNSNSKITLRIAIDKNLIGLSKTYKGFLEFDYWWGPKFSDDISSIQSGVTRYETDKKHNFFSGVSGTEFWWKNDENEKTLEIEEIRVTPSLGINENSYGCRYIHSIFDSSKQEFIHFDGAIRLYSEENIFQRWDTNINKAGKNTEYTKIFRIDGKLELNNWKKLCILYYKGNPLLFEYFGAKDEYDKLGEISKKQTPSDNYLSYKVKPEDCIRFFASYHNKQDNYDSFGRKVINPDIIRFQNGETIKVLEYDILEIEKYLKREGSEFEYPENINFVKPFDYYTNYPIIIHGSSISKEQSINKTLAAFKTIFQKQNLSLNKTISLTIGWEMKDFEVRLSIYGKSSEIVKWLNLNENIPVEYETFRKWLIEQRDWVNNNYEYIEKDFTHLLKSDGIFYIKRKSIDQNMVEFINENEIEYLKIKTNINDEIVQLVENKQIYPSKIGLIKKASCSKTGENYFTSNTSKYLDTDVKMIIEEIELLGLFWTDEEYN